MKNNIVFNLNRTQIQTINNKKNKKHTKKQTYRRSSGKGKGFVAEGKGEEISQDGREKIREEERRKIL